MQGSAAGGERSLSDTHVDTRGAHGVSAEE
jgi:hypothetical protein